MRLDDEAVAGTALEEKLERFNEEWYSVTGRDKKVFSVPVIEQVAMAAPKTSPVLSRVKGYTCILEDDFNPEPVVREAGERFEANVRENFPFDKSVSAEFRETDAGNPAYTISYMTEEVEIRYGEQPTSFWTLDRYLDQGQRNKLHMADAPMNHPSIVFDWRTPDGIWQRTEEYLLAEEILTQYRVNPEKALERLKRYVFLDDFLPAFLSYGGDAAENMAMMGEHVSKQYQEFRREQFTRTERGENP